MPLAKYVNCPNCGTLSSCIGEPDHSELSGTCPSCGWGIVIDTETGKTITHEELVSRGEAAKANRQKEAQSGVSRV